MKRANLRKSHYFLKTAYSVCVCRRPQLEEKSRIFPLDE